MARPGFRDGVRGGEGLRGFSWSVGVRGGETRSKSESNRCENRDLLREQRDGNSKIRMEWFVNMRRSAVFTVFS